MANYPSIDAELLRSFVAIADHGGFTRAADAVNRTQSAISMQMKRLEEDVLQRALFERNGRQVRLTAEGQVLLGYARRILKLHGEVLTTFREPHMVGSVRIGTPDDYVMRFLPGILSRFAQAYPLVQVELHCEPSFQLLQRSDLDLTIVTREPGAEIGQLLRRERVVWAEAPGFNIHEQRPVPLAVFNAECFCRAWACNALDSLEIPYRVAYTSPSLSALMAVVNAGLAVTAQMQSLLAPDMRQLGEAEGFPELPISSIVLLRNEHRRSQVSETLAEHIVEGFRL
ncbi:LysR substrate-binding domain-containing protein [Stutzerimonas stutzeri]|uniref:LysR family transcriptional regulator n=1 Tax=Stutzerimonas stutzeri TaxID=316 RepID=A0A6I6LR72_STUST|nr:LysR substrate-binding domain-containing protein [Stutzerimonas stutzeri]QGZ31730.1 LysR family transcriptional regulator [Stutzerimonas stutzeri]